MVINCKIPCVFFLDGGRLDEELTFLTRVQESSTKYPNETLRENGLGGQYQVVFYSFFVFSFFIILLKDVNNGLNNSAGEYSKVFRSLPMPDKNVRINSCCRQRIIIKNSDFIWVYTFQKWVQSTGFILLKDM